MAITAGKKDIHELTNKLLLNKGDLVNGIAESQHTKIENDTELLV